MLQADGVQNLVMVPLVIEEVLIGSLNLGGDTPELLMPEQLEVAGELGTQLAIGLHQAQLAEQLQRYTDKLEDQVQRRTAALQASQARLRAIFDNAPVGIALIDTQGRLVQTNPGLQAMLGYTAEELEDKNFGAIIHPEDVEADEKLFQELLAGKQGSYSCSRRYIHKDGHYIWGELHLSPVRDPHGALRFVVSMVEDVTEQRATQQALIRSEKLSLTGRLAASLAHEINNPLQAVIGCMELAQESLEEGEQDDACQMLQIGTEELLRAAGIVSRLRNLNQPVDLGDKKLADVAGLVNRVLLLTEKQCRKQGIEVVWQPETELPMLPLVPGQIEQVFLNLVLNAVDAMSNGGRLDVQAFYRDKSDGVSITFADNGCGIPPDVLQNIFEPFTTTKQEGLGLGLYVTHSIVTAHGGHIDVESQVDQGTTFTVWLPVNSG